MPLFATKAMRLFTRLELHEVVGLLVTGAAVLVFFVFAKRLDESIGVQGYHWKVVSDVVGMYQNVITWVFTGVLTGLFLLLAILRRQNHARLQQLAFLVRVLIAFCIMMAIYKIVNFYITVFNPVGRDATLQMLDRIIFFGKLPSEWMESIIWRPLTYVLSTAYMSWFVLTYVTIVLMMTHSRRAVVEYVFTTLATFYVGYLTYIFVPAVGPIYTVHYAHALGGLASMFIHDDSLVAYDCFPSLHTGIALVMLVNVWRYRRTWTYIYGPLVFLIIWSTLYLRFHYGIDDIAGTALAIVMTQISPGLVSAWERRRQGVAHNKATTRVIEDGAASTIPGKWARTPNAPVTVENNG